MNRWCEAFYFIFVLLTLIFIQPLPILAVDEITFKNELAVITYPVTTKSGSKKDLEKQEQSIVEDQSQEAVRKVVDWVVEDAGHDALRPEYKKISERIINNFRQYIASQEVVRRDLKQEKKGFFGGGPWLLTLEMRYLIKKDDILKEMAGDVGALAQIKKYDVYVELYWITKKEDMSPELIEAVRSNVEKILNDQGFNIVTFDKIRDDILVMQLKDRADLANIDVDRLDQFEKEFLISQVSKYERGMSILEKYAQVVVGATINHLEVSDDKVAIKIASEAQLIRGGKRRVIGRADITREAPNAGGSQIAIDNLGGAAAQDLAGKTAGQMRKKLSEYEKEQQVIIPDSPREFKLVFAGMSDDEFYTIRRLLKENESGQDWKYLSENSSDKSVALEFKGRTGDLSDRVYDFLKSKNSMNIKVPESTQDSLKITFRKGAQ